MHEVSLYGWVELGYDGTNVFIVNGIMGSAMETTGLGIYAGTGNVFGDSAIPEPASALLAFSGVALLLRRRRKKEKVIG